MDIYQVGARNMQNFNLLRELGRVRKPVMLKRGISATIEEWLLSAEYILSGGNYDVILCERGIRTFETYTRNTMDISAIPVCKKLSHLPVAGRSLARHRPAGQSRAHGARGGSRRRRLHHGRSPLHSRQGPVGRRAVALSQAIRRTDEGVRMIAPAVGRGVA